MDNIPPGCTCIWTQTDTRGAIFIRGDDCPVWPHPRTYTTTDSNSTKDIDHEHTDTSR